MCWWRCEVAGMMSEGSLHLYTAARGDDVLPHAVSGAW